MKAVVLVGGEGTRMRPLTETIPKPLIPLVDRPFLRHVIDHLEAHGIGEVLLSSSYLEEAFTDFLGSGGPGPPITWIAEPTPLGTGGAIANAARRLNETFLVVNGDILTDLDLTALVAFHRSQTATATIALTQVQDARPFGLVDLDGAGRVRAFREKPPQAVPGVVNAGTYVLEPDAVAGIPGERAVSVEREVFPGLIERRERVAGFVSPAYWRDLGTPEQYLRATFDALDGRVGGLAYVAPHVDPSAAVSLRAHLGRWVVVAARSSVGDEAEVEDSVLLAGSMVEAGAKVRDSIVGPSAFVGEGAVVQGAVLAEGARVASGLSTEGARVSAGASLQG
jgi:mannose-1-phosphate guanylyltransferase